MTGFYGPTQNHWYRLPRYVKCIANCKKMKIAQNIVTVRPNVLCATRITQPTLRHVLFLSQFPSSEITIILTCTKTPLSQRKIFRDILLIRLFLPSPPWLRPFLVSGLKFNILPQILTSNQYYRNSYLAWHPPLKIFSTLFLHKYLITWP